MAKDTKTSKSSIAPKAVAPVSKPKKAAKAKAEVASAKSKNVSVAKSSVKKTHLPKKAIKKAAPKKTAATKRKISVKTPVQKNIDIPQLLLSDPNKNQMMETIMTQSKTQFDAFSKDATDASRESVEAIIKSSTIFAKGFEDIMRVSAELAQDAAEKQARYVKEAMSSKTLNEWSEAQSKIAQANFDDFVAGATKISEMGIKVLNEASKPVNDQVGKAVKKASKSVAA